MRSKLGCSQISANIYCKICARCDANVVYSGDPAMHISHSLWRQSGQALNLSSHVSLTTNSTVAVAECFSVHQVLFYLDLKFKMEPLCNKATELFSSSNNFIWVIVLRNISLHRLHSRISYNLKLVFINRNEDRSEIYPCTWEFAIAAITILLSEGQFSPA